MNIPTPPLRDIRLSHELPHPAAHVWRAVADRVWLSRWFMPTQDLELWVGHAFTFRKAGGARAFAGWDGITHCEILEVDPGRRLAFKSRGLGRLDTVLRFTVDPLGPERSRLHVEHAGFRGPKGVVIRLVLGREWKKILRERLPKTLAEALKEVAAPKEFAATKETMP